MGMNFKKFLLTAIPVTFATAFFACSEKIAGTTETDNALANEESSSSNGGTTEEISMSSAISSSSDGATSLSSSIFGTSSSISVIIPSSSSISIVSPDFNTDSLIMNPPMGSQGGGGGSTVCIDSAIVNEALRNTITLSKFIDGRIEKLMATGLTQEQASSTAKQELFATLGIDTFFLEQPDQMKFISNLLNYVLGGTVTSDFYKEAKNNFTETGTLSKENYCNFETYSATEYNTLPITGRTTRAFNSHFLYERTMYQRGNCKGLYVVPTKILDVVDAKCYDIPRCDSSIIDTVVKASYNTLEGLFTCRVSGWEHANIMETRTFDEACDKEGKYIFYEKKPDTSFVCNLQSGWKAAETIDAETFGTECDKHGKLFQSPNRPGTTYVCRLDSFCRDNGPYNDPHCLDSGWDFANKTDLETANSECDSEGKTYQSPSDANLTYVCHDGKWTEFFNMPCDTDNKRIKVKRQNINGFVEYICYNKTWRPTYEWHTDYPAEYYFNPEINYGSFTDPRDNYVYHTVVYKGRTWIAENMKYAGFSESELAKETRCLEDSCKNVGRFYSINVADKVCPDGWSLPDSSDMLTLGTRQPETEKNISQLGGTGSEYSAPDTYGLSFILSGRIVDTDQPYSPWQRFRTLFWMKETNAEGSRLAVSLGYYEIEFYGYYRKNPTGIPDYPDMNPTAYSYQTYLTIRCLKK